MLRRCLGFGLVAFSLAGCGSTTFGGLGPDDDDAGLFDDSATGDAIFPTDDVSTADTKKADTASGDTAVIDSAVVDSGAHDTATPDTTTLDTGTLDTATSDTGTPDTGTPDTGTLDTGTPDTGTPDTGTPDTGTPDTGTPDTGTPDTGTPDTGTPDTGTADTGTDTAPPWTDVVGKVGCYTSAPVQCDKDCCGGIDITFSWNWQCRDGCNFGERSYACDQTADCDSGQVCCTSTNGFGTVNGSSCKTATGCGGDKQLCATSAECGSKTCVAYTPPDTKFTVGVCN